MLYGFENWTRTPLPCSDKKLRGDSTQDEQQHCACGHEGDSQCESGGHRLLTGSRTPFLSSGGFSANNPLAASSLPNLGTAFTTAKTAIRIMTGSMGWR